MKKTLIVLAAAVSMSMPAFAATSHTVPVSASVGQVTELTMVVNERAAGTDLPINSPLAQMAYGQLVNNGFGALVSSKNFAVYLAANTSSREYNITSTMAALTSGANTLPPAMGMSVVSAKDASGNDISGDTVVALRNAIMTSQEIYRSNTSGTGASVELWYGIAGYAAGGAAPFTGFQPVLPDQASGSYSSTIQYTLNLI